MNFAIPVSIFALIRDGQAMGQYYYRARRDNPKPAVTPRSRLFAPSLRSQLLGLRERALPPSDALLIINAHVQGSPTFRTFAKCELHLCPDLHCVPSPWFSQVNPVEKYLVHVGRLNETVTLFLL